MNFNGKDFNSERDYFSQGLCVPAYDISAQTVCWQFRAQTYKTPYDAWYLSRPEGKHGFRVATIDDVQARAL